MHKFFTKSFSSKFLDSMRNSRCFDFRESAYDSCLLCFFSIDSFLITHREKIYDFCDAMIHTVHT